MLVNYSKKAEISPVSVLQGRLSTGGIDQQLGEETQGRRSDSLS